MQYLNDMSKFWLRGPFFDTGSDGGNGDGNVQSDSSETATDGKVGGNSDGNANVTGDATTQNNDNAQDGDLPSSELLAKYADLEGKYERLGDSYGRQTTVLGDLRKQLQGEPAVDKGESTQSNTGSVTLTQDQFDQLMVKRNEDPSGSANNAMQPLQQQITSLTSSVEQFGDHLLHQRMVEKFTPAELQGYEPRVIEMGKQLASGAVSYEEVLNFAVRGERINHVIAQSKKAGEEEYKAKLQTEANATIPSAGTGKQQSPGARQRREVVEADDAHERMYGKKQAS